MTPPTHPTPPPSPSSPVGVLTGEQVEAFWRDVDAAWKANAPMTGRLLYGIVLLRESHEALRAELGRLRSAQDERAKDAERYAFLKARYDGFEFDYGREVQGVPLLLFALPVGSPVAADLDATLDAARNAVPTPTPPGTPGIPNEAG